MEQNMMHDDEQYEEGQINEPNGPILGGKGYIPGQTMRKAYYELDESLQTKQVCVRMLRQIIEEQKEENNFDDHTDSFLLKFLRHRKFDVEDAYKLLEAYYENRETKPEIFRNLTRKNVKKTLQQGIVCVMPQRDSNGRVIIVFNFSSWNFSLPFHFEKMLRVWVYTLEKLFESEETQINGITIVCDLRQLSVLQTKSLRTSMLTKVISVFQDRFPFRVCNIHLLNPSWHFKLLWKVTNVPSLIKPKLMGRINLHEGEMTNFYEEIPKKYLPVEIGGSVEYDHTLWVEELLEPEQSEQYQQLQTSAHIQSLTSRQHHHTNYQM